VGWGCMDVLYARPPALVCPSLCRPTSISSPLGCGGRAGDDIFCVLAISRPSFVPKLTPLASDPLQARSLLKAECRSEPPRGKGHVRTHALARTFACMRTARTHTNEYTQKEQPARRRRHDSGRKPDFSHLPRATYPQVRAPTRVDALALQPVQRQVHLYSYSQRPFVHL
jgi:hypothetical protein